MCVVIPLGPMPLELMANFVFSRRYSIHLT
jgi:hypothetical protein